MKNKYWIIILLILIILGFGIFFFFKNKRNENENNPNSEYTVNKTEASVKKSNTDINNEISKNNNTNTSKDTTTNNTNGINNPQNTNENVQPQQQSIPVETQIASFTTKILTKDASRQKNISITCSTLNGTLVEHGKTFSFCNTVGQATTAKGYEKAEIFDSNRA